MKRGCEERRSFGRIKKTTLNVNFFKMFIFLEHLKILSYVEIFIILFQMNLKDQGMDIGSKSSILERQMEEKREMHKKASKMKFNTDGR